MQQFMIDSKKMSNFLEFHVKEASRRHYSYHLQLFFLWKKEASIDSYIRDPRRMNIDDKFTYEDGIKNDIRGYWKYITEESDKFHGKTAYPFLSAMRRFLESSEIVFSPEFWRNLRTNGNGNYAVTNFQTPTKDQLKSILSNADVEAKALFMTQLTSGQRLEQMLKLTWNDIQLEHEYPRIFIRKQKGKRTVKTRITPETKEYLIEYKKQSDRIIAVREKRTPRSVKKPLDKNLVFPMSDGTAETMWNNLTNKAGLYIRDSVTPLPLMGTHSLRRYFQTHFGNENDALFFMGKTPENIATYYRMNDEQLDLVYIKGAENLVIFKEKSDTPSYLREYDEKMNDVTDKLETSKERIDMYKDRLKTQEERLKKIENILIRNIQDSVDPFEGKALSKEEDEFEDQLTDKMILEKERKLKHLIATNPLYTDAEIVYIDQSWDEKTQRFKHAGPPLLKKKENKKTRNYFVDKMLESVALNAFINLDEKKLEKLKEEGNQFKQGKIIKQLSKKEIEEFKKRLEELKKLM